MAIFKGHFCSFGINWIFIIICSVQANANIDVVSLWNDTGAENGTGLLCLLKDENIDGQNTTQLMADNALTCSAQITSSEKSLVLIKISDVTSPNTFLYVKKQDDLLDCQNRYVVIEASSQCFVFLSHPKAAVFLQGNTSVRISSNSSNITGLQTMCPNIKPNGTNHGLAGLTFCQTKEFDQAMSCSDFTDYRCVFTLHSGCNASLDNRQINFNCPDDEFHSSHTALIIYPDFMRALDFSHGNIKEIAANAFGHLPNLVELVLDNNILITLKARAFAGLPNLRKLYLRWNVLQTLHNETFKGLVRLTELHLNLNQISMLPSGVFKGLINLELLRLNHNQITSIDAELFSDLINLTYLSLYVNKVSMLPERVFSNLINLTDLIIANNEIVSLPRGLFEGLTNIKFIDIGGNKISSLDASMFNDTEEMEFLYLYYNNLTILPRGVFDKLANTLTFSMHGNRISSLDEDLFKNTRMLRRLVLDTNNLIALPRGLFKGLTNLEKISFYGNQVVSLDASLFNETRELIEVSIFRNKLRYLPKHLFRELNSLRVLLLDGNEIRSLDSVLFHGAPNLRSLNLEDNTISEIPDDLFWTLQHLSFLNLGGNRLSKLHPATFKGVRNLQILYLHSNNLRELDINLFSDIKLLWFLEISTNQLTNIPSLEALDKLTILGLRENTLNMIDKYTFTGLTDGTEMFVSQAEVCECYVPNEIECTALDVRSPHLTCERLLSDKVLMVLMWIIGLNALCGNLFVLSRKKDKDQRIAVQTFLLNNLAMSDLLMGVYMLIIASADIYFGNDFPMQAQTWRTGITCRIAGSIAIVSSEASVFFVTLISIDRFVNIRFPYSQRKLNKRSSRVIVALLWAISLALGIVPSIFAGENYKFYENSHVCIGLPLVQIERFSNEVVQKWTYNFNFLELFRYATYVVKSESLGRVPGLYYASAIFLGLNGIMYFVIFLCYAEIVRTAFRSAKQAGIKKDMKDQIKFTRNVAAIVLTDFFCWAPVIVMGILVQCNVLVLPSAVYAWSVTVILPINSAINPYLYTIAGIISNRRKKRDSRLAKHTQNTNLPRSSYSSSKI